MTTFQSAYQPYLAIGGSQSYTILGNTYTTTSTPFEIPITNYGETYTTTEALPVTDYGATNSYATTAEAYPVTNYSTAEYTIPIETTSTYDLGAYQTSNYAATSAPAYEALSAPNKKTLDTEKNKINEDQSKFQQKKEEIQKTFISQEQMETGDFLCSNCGHRLLGFTELMQWYSRENNGIKKFIFYGIDDDFGEIPKYWWCGKMEKKYHG